MFVASGWKDFEVLYAGWQEKYERWGDALLRRPDPQAVWPVIKNGREAEWNQIDKPNAVYVRSDTGGGAWKKIKSLPPKWNINYESLGKKLEFIIEPTSFKHTGLFPEQAVNWDCVTQLIKNSDRPLKVLNLFAYTGGATIACLKAGASVVHVDASKGMVQWAKENAKASGVEDRPVRWIVDDCIKFVQREIRRGNRYDIIIMDPPSYGRGPGGEVWKLEDEVYDFVALCEQVLSDDAKLMLINSYTTGLSPSVMQYILQAVVQLKHGGAVTCDEIGLPVAGTDRVLPCGASAFWLSKP